MSSRSRRGNGRSSSWVAAVASVSREHINREGARRGGKEAAEGACADRDEGASEDQAPEEDLARQVETRHACPAACGAVACPAARLGDAPGARTNDTGRSELLLATTGALRGPVASER